MKQCELEIVTSPEDFDRSTGEMLCRRTGMIHVCWLELPKTCKVGDIISLKDWQHIFVINKIHEPELEKVSIKHGWKVGGL